MTQRDRRSGQARRPEIEVHHPSSTRGELLRHIGAGIEEEGVPYVLVPREHAPDAATTAAAGAASSLLGVAIGVAEDGSVAVAHESFPAERPVLRHGGPLAPPEARRLGQNAARVVTRLPLVL